MKKNNKGFTLVELLAIILIIAIIGLIAVPNISKQIKNNEDRQNRLLNQRITNAAHTYAAKYYADKMISLTPFSFSLSDLEQDGLLDLKSDECSNRRDGYIYIDRSGTGIFFNFSDLTDDDCVYGDPTKTDPEEKGIYALW